MRKIDLQKHWEPVGRLTVPHAVASSGVSLDFYRSKVPGGWLLLQYQTGTTSQPTITFIPDAAHEWRAYEN